MARLGSGIEVRASSIRLHFVYQGETYAERFTLNGKSLKPTPANVKYATRLANDIRRAIALGTFTFAEFFPDSPRAQAESIEPSTLGKLAELWLESRGKLSDATKDQYATAVRFWKKLLGESTKVKDITHKVVSSKIGGYPWPSAKTHNNYMIALRGIFGLEYRGAEAANNPLNGIENMPTVKKLPDPLSIEERDNILADMQGRYDERIYAYFLWQFFTGMRPEETIALRWSDIDWHHQIARVQRVRTFKGSERDGSKTHTERDVNLLPQAMEALRIMKAHTFMKKQERGEDTAADIFQNPVTKRSWHDERSQRDHYWRPTIKRLGIRWRRPYCTRSTYASVALAKGIPPAYIADQLGNSVKMLLDRYARYIPGNDNGDARKMMMAAMGGLNSSQTLPKKQTAQSK